MNVLTFILQHVNTMALYSLTRTPYNSQVRVVLTPYYHPAVESPGVCDDFDNPQSDVAHLRVH